LKIKQSLSNFKQLTPGIQRLLAPNPGMMTGPGTNTYLLGQKEIAVIDPGPAIASHIAMIQKIVSAPIRWIIVTHTHLDHSPAAQMLAEATGAELLGQSPPAGSNQDQTFSPHRILNNGDKIETEEFTLTAIHTPGHASNHLCYLHEKLQWIFTGDHVMNGSTVVINPPDGNMKDYLDSLAQLKILDPKKLAPGHGDLLPNPQATLDWIITHRLEREAKIITTLDSMSGRSLTKLVKKAYDDIDAKLHPLAERSLLAHLIKLNREYLANEKNGLWYLS
jgi:glyoxylase-like metal-dependent hydrolase (beta-lactamase superfamily II)